MICVLGGYVCGDPLAVYIAILIISAIISIIVVPTLFLLYYLITGK